MDFLRNFFVFLKNRVRKCLIMGLIELSTGIQLTRKQKLEIGRYDPNLEVSNDTLRLDIYDASNVGTKSFISRKQTEISYDPYTGWKVEDLGSKNGTLVGAAILHQGESRKLEQGSIIYIRSEANKFVSFRVRVFPGEFIFVMPSPNDSGVTVKLRES